VELLDAVVVMELVKVVVWVDDIVAVVEVEVVAVPIVDV
jgi:hypothetical protein